MKKEEITYLSLKQDSSSIYPEDVDVIAEGENGGTDLVMTFRNGMFKRYFFTGVMAEKLGIEREAENFKIKEEV